VVAGCSLLLCFFWLSPGIPSSQFVLCMSWFSLCFIRLLCGWSLVVPWSSASCPSVGPGFFLSVSMCRKELDRLVSRLVQKTIQITSFETELLERSLLWLSCCSNSGCNVPMRWNNIYCLCNIFS